jgi:hypothetical protein
MRQPRRLGIGTCALGERSLCVGPRFVEACASMQEDDRHEGVGSVIHGLFRVASCVLALCTAACSPNVRLFQTLPGKEVEQKIDETLAPYMTSYDPKLKIAPSQCEPVIILSLGITGTCKLPINGVPIDIRVVSADPPYAFKVDFGGAFFFHMPTVEKIVENFLLSSYHIAATANCGNPRERLLQPGTSWECTIDGSPKVRSVKVEVASNGQVFTHNVPGLKVASVLPMDLLAGHKSGKTTVVRGADVKAFYLQMMAGESGANSYPENTVIRCPNRMDLTGNRRGVCTAKIPKLNTPQRISVTINDTNGYVVKPIDALIDRGRVQKMAQDDLNRRLTDGGFAADALVVCEKGFIVVAVPGTFSCYFSGAGKHYRLLVAVDDEGRALFPCGKINRRSTPGSRAPGA